MFIECYYKGGIYILPIGDIIVNHIVVLIISISYYIGSLNWISGKKDKTELTKNIKLNRRRKILLMLFFYKEGIDIYSYKEDKVEMEFVISQIVNYILTIIFAVASFYVDLQPKTLSIYYLGSMAVVYVGCLIYRFKKNDFKDNNNHY